jgi:hypothetical protein
MWFKIINSTDTSNMTKNDVQEVSYPKRLVDDNGIQYPISVLQKFTSQEIIDLFGLYKYDDKKYLYSTLDNELEQAVFSHYSLENNQIVEYETKESKTLSQDQINSIVRERQKTEDLTYRTKRRQAYFQRLSPEQDSITALGEVVDAIYQAIYHGDVEKLEFVSNIIEGVKADFPNSANVSFIVTSDDPNTVPDPKNPYHTTVTNMGPPAANT